MILRVTQYGEPILRKVGEPITEFSGALAELAKDMVDTMYDEEGVGLAAQQVDRALQICVIDVCPPEGVEVPFTYNLDGKQPPLGLIMPMAIVNPKVTIIDQTEDVYGLLLRDEAGVFLDGLAELEHGDGAIAVMIARVEE